MRQTGEDMEAETDKSKINKSTNKELVIHILLNIRGILIN